MTAAAAILGWSHRIFGGFGQRLDPWERRRRAGFRRRRRDFYEDLWQRAAGAAGASLDDLGRGRFRLVRGDRWTMVREHEVMLDSHLALDLAGDKPLVHRLLAERGVPVPRFVEYDLATLDRAMAFMHEIGSVVIKPAEGTGAGRGITTQVASREDVLRASIHASRFCQTLLAEEERAGASFRLLYLGGELVDAIRRDPPTVLGDGRRSVRSLMARETESRLGACPARALSPLEVDLETRLTLRGAGRSPRSVPAAGERVAVKQVVNQNAARENHVVTGQVHPALVRLGAEIASALRLELVGIDLITPEIGQPLAEAGGVVNEVNTTPGLHHHELVAERPRDFAVATAILEHVLARSALPRRATLRSSPPPHVGEPAA